jgi:hypothetical protein
MKSKCAGLLLLCTIALGASRQAAPAAQTAGELRGTVRTKDGKPAGGASVTITPLMAGTAATATAGPDGTFRAASIEAGLYQVAFALSGYAPLTVERVRFDSAPLVIDRVLVPIADADHVAVLAAGDNTERGRLSGQLTDTGQHPVPFAWIALASSVSGAPTFQRTDAEGRFDVPSLPVGLYTLHAAAGGYETVTRYPTVAKDETASMTVPLWSSADVLGRPFLAQASLHEGEWLLSLETALGRTFIAMTAQTPQAFRQAVDAHTFDNGRLVAAEKTDANRVLSLTPAPGASLSVLRFEQPLTGEVKFTYDNATFTGRILEGADVLLDVPPALSDVGPNGAPVIAVSSIRPRD